jgi:TonB family protein
VVSDSPGVTVDVGAATLMHRAPVPYPDSARSKGVQGAVVLELTFDGSGSVADARVLSGPDELRKAALQSALQWHFAREAAGAKRQVTISFALSGTPEPEALAVRVPDMPRAAGAGERKRTVKSIRVLGTSDQVRDELLAGLPVRIGNVVGNDEISAAFRYVRQFDEHLNVSILPASADEVNILVVAPSPNATPRAEAAIGVATTNSEIDGQRIKVGGNVQSSKLIRQIRPVYPADAKAARIQGVVKLSAVIAKDGTIKQLEVISGHPLFIAPTLEAVRQWVYETTLLNGSPVEVQTQIDVNYTLSQ